MVVNTQQIGRTSPADTTHSDEHAQKPAAAVFTIEFALYAAIFLLGATLRFWDLAQFPLNGSEAVNALAAWSSVSGRTLAGAVNWLDTASYSALLYQMQRLLFWLGAQSDAAARIPVATAGALLVLTPILFRFLIGRSKALLLSLLIAMDPWLVYFSRTADGSMLSILIAISLLGMSIVLMTHGLHSNGRERLSLRFVCIVMAIMAGLFLTSGPLAWSLLPVLVVFGALHYRQLVPVLVLDWRIGLWFGAAFVIGATGWLSDLTAVGQVSTSLTMWVDQLFANGNATAGLEAGVAYAILWPLSRLLGDQPFVFLFGLGGLLHLTSQRRYADAERVRWLTFLWLWLAWGVLLNLLPGRGPHSLLVLIFPLLFGAAHALLWLVTKVTYCFRNRETLAAMATLLVLLVSAFFLGASLTSNSMLDILTLQSNLLLLLLAFALLVFVGIYIGWHSALVTGIAALAVLLLLVQAGSAWRVNFRYELGQAAGLSRVMTHIDIRNLVRDIEDYSAQQFGDMQNAVVAIDLASQDPAGRLTREQRALLAWYLRDRPFLEWGIGNAAGAPSPPLILSAGSRDADAGYPGNVNYVGSNYRIQQVQRLTPAETGLEPYPVDGNVRAWVDQTWMNRIQPWLRWLIYREPLAEPAVEQVTLWATWQDQ